MPTRHGWEVSGSVQDLQAVAGLHRYNKRRLALITSTEQHVRCLPNAAKMSWICLDPAAILRTSGRAELLREERIRMAERRATVTGGCNKLCRVKHGKAR